MLLRAKVRVLNHGLREWKMTEKIDENADDLDEEIEEFEQQNNKNKKFLDGLGK